MPAARRSCQIGCSFSAGCSPTLMVKQCPGAAAGAPSGCRGRHQSAALHARPLHSCTFAPGPADPQRRQLGVQGGAGDAEAVDTRALAASSCSTRAPRNARGSVTWRPCVISQVATGSSDQRPGGPNKACAPAGMAVGVDGSMGWRWAGSSRGRSRHLRGHASRSAITPASIAQVPITLRGVMTSLNNHTPSSAANRTEVSRSAATMATGACVMAHRAMP
jgi:hypothetical protein